MIPPEPDADTPDSESYVFGRLRDKLPASWTVLHARRFFLPARGGQSRVEGELDFLLVDPDCGCLGLEVKGGGVERTPNGWRQTGKDGAAHDMQDPGKQAQRSIHALSNYLAEQPWFRSHKVKVPYGWAVVLPDVDVRASLGPDLPRELVIGREDFARLPAAIAGAFDAAGIPDSGLAPGAAEALIDALAPTFRLVRPLARQIDEERDALIRLTEEQADLLDLLGAMPRVAIQGGAGTGKTLLAAEWARRLAAEGSRVLLLCYNRHLADHLAANAAGYDVNTFHGMCHDLSEQADVPFEIPEHSRKQNEFWKQEAPLRLLEALDGLPEQRWDAVIVDEGQDFHADWWPAVEALLRDPGQGRLVAFYDPNQNIYNGGPPEALDVSPASLRWNCRNTGNIARHVAQLVDVDAGVKPGMPDGTEVEIITCRTPAETVEKVRLALERLVETDRLDPDQIVVLTTHAPGKSPLHKNRKLGSFHLAPPGSDAAPNQVRFTSLYQFKGLEADAVILTDVEPGEFTSSEKHLYVGASRARHVLIVIQLVAD